MDPLTTAIVAAVTAMSAGAASGLTETGKNVVIDVYNVLKTKIVQKFGKENQIIPAIAELEKEPTFKPHQATLAGRITQNGADKDEELLQLVKQLKEALESTQEGRAAMSTYQINLTNCEIGSYTTGNATIHGGIHLHGRK